MIHTISSTDLPILPARTDAVIDLISPNTPGATVIKPPNGDGDISAERIVSEIQRLHGVVLPVRNGSMDMEPLSTRHVIALGSMADNPYIESLYLRFQTLVDRWYPGPGGYVLQFVPSPRILDNHAFIIGWSDVSDVSDATNQFIEVIADHPSGRIPWMIRAKLGDAHYPLPEDRMDCLGTAASPVAVPENQLPDKPYCSGYSEGPPRDYLLRAGMYGPHADNFHLCRSSQLGLRYLYSTDTSDARRFRATLLEEIDAGVLDQLYHYKSLRLIQLWPLLGDHPVFSREERDRIDRALYRYLVEESGIASIEHIVAQTTDEGLFNRHYACDALNLWAGADWLWRRSHDATWLDYQSVADAYFESQTGTNVPLTGLTEGYGSYLEVYLEWLQWTDAARIADHSDIRLWGERLLGLCTNTGCLVTGPQTDRSRFPYILMFKLSHFLNDACFLQMARMRERQVAIGNDRLVQFSAGQAYASELALAEFEPGPAVHLYPMNERLRRWKAPSLAQGDGFDRFVARSGYQVDDDYLMIIGVRSGAKSLPNVGALGAYERYGQSLITSEATALYPASVSPWRHSTITVNIGGSGYGMAEGALVTANRDSGGGHVFCIRTELPGHHTWTRMLFWQPDGYLLVIDQVETHRTEPFSVGINWRCSGPVSIDGDLGTMTLNGPVAGRFYLQFCELVEMQTITRSYPVLGAVTQEPAARESMVHGLVSCASDSRTVTVATLLHAVADAQGPAYRLIEADTGYHVLGVDQSWRVTITSSIGDLAIQNDRRSGVSINRDQPSAPTRTTYPTKWPAVDNRWECPVSGDVTAQCGHGESGHVVIGTASGDVQMINASGGTEWTAILEDSVSALTHTGDGVVAGTEAGQIVRFDASGNETWRHRCGFLPERTFWPWWFMRTPAIGALAVGHEQREHRSIVAAGTGSTNLLFLDGHSGRVLANKLSPYGFPDRIKVCYDGPGANLSFLVGHSWLTSGSVVRSWTPPFEGASQLKYFESVDAMGRTQDEWDTCGVVDFWQGTLALGHGVNTIVLRHGAVNQLTLYEANSGIPIWDAGIGGASIALAVVPGDDLHSARIHVAEEFGWLITFDGYGNRLHGSRILPDILGMSLDSEGRLWIWNGETLLESRGDRELRRFHHGGKPLTWNESRLSSGLLCVRDQQLILVAVKDAPGTSLG